MSVPNPKAVPKYRPLSERDSIERCQPPSGRDVSLRIHVINESDINRVLCHCDLPTMRGQNNTNTRALISIPMGNETSRYTACPSFIHHQRFFLRVTEGELVLFGRCVYILRRESERGTWGEKQEEYGQQTRTVSMSTKTK